MRTKLINGEKIQLTSEEEILRDTEEQQAILKQEQDAQEKQDAINKKASGKQKLLDLGLTEEEVKALIGV